MGDDAAKSATVRWPFYDVIYPPHARETIGSFSDGADRAMDVLNDLATWAWARHHNEWSWYVRPLFLIPFCWLAWRRSLVGIALTVFALASSMFWFPAPDVPSGMALEVLAAEREYLLGPWTWWKVVIALLVPATFTGLALAFWNRSFGWGLLVVNIIALTKIAWTFVFFTVEGAVYHLVPAASGLAVCNAVLIVAWRLWVDPRSFPGRASSRSCLKRRVSFAGPSATLTGPPARHALAEPGSRQAPTRRRQLDRP